MVVKDHREFELKLIESLESYPPREDREGIADTDLVTTPEEAFEALKATRGADALLKDIPAISDLALWSETAYFSVCKKTGTARYLDLWDTDHFDGVTHMQRCVSDCRAWFAGDGYSQWGSGETKTGRINCYFSVPTTGKYICNAKLQSYGGPARVECLIDNSTFGFLGVSGTIDQPHPCSLSSGFHHFRIRQVSGSFFFIGLTVWKT